MTKTSAIPRLGYRLASAVGLALALAATGVFSPAADGTVAAQALNPCALLPVDDIEPLAAKASVAEGVASPADTFGAVTCRYAWGEGVNRYKLAIIVNDAPRMYPGMGPDQIKGQLLASVRAETADAILEDIGEVAVFKAESPVLATATTSFKGHILKLQLDGVVAREKKDQMAALLKAAVARL